MSKQRNSSKMQARQVRLSEGTKKTLLISTGCLLLIVGGWWAYFTFTTISPPDVKTTSASNVVQYLGNDRGFARLNCNQRAEFLGNMWNAYSDDKRMELAQSLDRMSQSEKRVFVDAAFEMVKVDFVKRAGEFNKLPKSKRDQFVDDAINQLDLQRQSIAGGVSKHGPSGNRTNTAAAPNLARSFDSCVPNTTDGITKALVTRTSPSERAKAQPLLDAIMVRYKEREQQR